MQLDQMPWYSNIPMYHAQTIVVKVARAYDHEALGAYVEPVAIAGIVRGILSLADAPSLRAHIKPGDRVLVQQIGDAGNPLISQIISQEAAP